MSFVNLAQRQGIPDPDNRGMTSVAEAGYVDSDSQYGSPETRHDGCVCEPDLTCH